MLNKFEVSKLLSLWLFDCVHVDAPFSIAGTSLRTVCTENGWFYATWLTDLLFLLLLAVVEKAGALSIDFRVGRAVFAP